MKDLRRILVGLGAWVLPWTLPAGGTPALPEASVRSVAFDTEIRPIFANHCVSCHGPEKQKGGLRLDRRVEALRGGDEHGPDIVPGKGVESPLFRMVAGLVPNQKMPARGEPLSPEQIELIRTWIDQGAAWPEDPIAETKPQEADHWAFRPVERPQVPVRTIEGRGAARNPIDGFIREKLAERQLVPSAEADRWTLIRRVTFDLTGLPPTPAEVASFVSDARPEAYDELVDRLLASPRFGERWARHWLDVVRYAETHGFEMNNPRPNAWPYRDYVIRAFNEDKPYDQFIIEQIAGDVVGVDEGTGFLVAGAWDQVKSPDEVLTRNQRADELHDIVNTTGTAFVALTLGCARCHDHKFDPVSQKDYYAFKALLAGVQHGEREVRRTERPGCENCVEDLRTELRQVERSLASREPIARVDDGLTDGGASNTATAAAVLRRPVQSGVNVDRFLPTEARYLRFTILESSGAEPCLDELEVYTAPATGNAENVALASHGTRATASGTYANSELHRLEHLNDGRYGNARSWISNEPDRGWVQLEFSGIERVDRVIWSRDRSPERVYSDRVAKAYKIELSLDGAVWRLAASSADRQAVNAGDSSTEGEKDGPRLDPETRALVQRQREIQRSLKELTAKPRIYAGEFREPEPTHRFQRGDPMQPKEVIEPAVLSFSAFQRGASPLPANLPEPQRRLALARWIASPSNPLTARVIVNRLWQYHFGEGLVATPSDFGHNGATPTHPELLDWLASELVEPTSEGATPWSLKHLHRLMVTSATYRQGSDIDPGGNLDPAAHDGRPALEVDTGNRLLWRYPSRRLEAEALRDAILATVDRLDVRMGGPGWSPFEPNENYVRVYTPKQRFEPSDFRRMVYATVVRQRPDGVFGVFDCPDGGQIAPRRTRSTTPLQALNLLNSAFIMQAADLFAERLEREGGPDARGKAALAFRLAFQRDATPEELSGSAQFIEAGSLPLFCRAILNANEFVFVF